MSISLTRTSVTADLEQVPTGLANLVGVHDLEVNGGEGRRIKCQVDTPELGKVLRYLSDYGIRNLASQPPSLEELFLRHYDTDQPGDPTNHNRPQTTQETTQEVAR